MPIEAIAGTMAGISALISLVFGGGLLKTAMSHSNELAVQKHIQAETSKNVADNEKAIQSLIITQALQDKDISGFKDHVKKLEMLPEISSKLSSFEYLLLNLKEQLREFRTERIEHDKAKN